MTVGDTWISCIHICVKLELIKSAHFPAKLEPNHRLFEVLVPPHVLYFRWNPNDSFLGCVVAGYSAHLLHHLETTHFSFILNAQESTKLFTTDSKWRLLFTICYIRAYICSSTTFHWKAKGYQQITPLCLLSWGLNFSWRTVQPKPRCFLFVWTSVCIL